MNAGKVKKKNTWTQQVRGHCNNQCEKYSCSYLKAIAVDTIVEKIGQVLNALRKQNQ